MRSLGQDSRTVPHATAPLPTVIMHVNSLQISLEFGTGCAGSMIAVLRPPSSIKTKPSVFIIFLPTRTFSRTVQRKWTRAC